MNELSESIMSEFQSVWGDGWKLEMSQSGNVYSVKLTSPTGRGHEKEVVWEPSDHCLPLRLARAFRLKMLHSENRQ